MSSQPLFARVLGDTFVQLPALVRAIHEPGERLVLRGRADVETGESFLARSLRHILGLPRQGRDLPLRVVIQPQADREIWTRHFGSRVLRTVLAATPGRRARVREHFGPVTLELALIADARGMTFRSLAAWVGPLLVPGPLRPKVRAREYDDGMGRFAFKVEVSVGAAGELIRYHGWLVPDTAPSAGPVLGRSPV